MDDKRYKELEKENNALADKFRKHLKACGLSDKTIRNHVDNVCFYLNDYLLGHYDDVDASAGIDYSYIADFLDYFFIRKCIWSTPSTLRSTAASLKKFYRFMYENDKVSKEAYDEFTSLLKESLADWCEDCRIYNDGGEYIVI